jgi:WS/DGAT/MGAT family acyltransferase
MPQQHLDRLSAVDASFLHQESANTHMHIGGVATFEGPPPTYEEFLAHIHARLQLVPRYRQRIVTPPFGIGRQRWIDDDRFNLEYHVRHTALPEPGGDEGLLRLAARIFSQRLDRAKPLWELWLVQGLERGRFALISKTHHCLVDGISGVDLMTMLFDLTPVPREIEEDGAWHPTPAPSEAALLASAAGGYVAAAGDIVGGMVGAATHPQRTAGRVAERLQGVGEVAWAGLNPPARTPLTGPIGPHRRFATVRRPLDDFKAIKNAFGGTVNDVVLACVSGALTRYLQTQGVRTEGLELRACVPVSVRTDADAGALGNQITQVLCPLPVYAPDPVKQLEFVRAAMADVKDGRQAIGAATIASLEDFAPPTILAQASRLHFSERMYTLLVTNIPGPQFPLYVLGRELEDIAPVAFLAGERALAVAIMSYNGRITFGLIGDYDRLRDLDTFAVALDVTLDELLAAATVSRSERDVADEQTAANAATRVSTNGHTA